MSAERSAFRFDPEPVTAFTEYSSTTRRRRPRRTRRQIGVIAPSGDRDADADAEREPGQVDLGLRTGVAAP
jgi:hypothetical protein